MSLVTGSLMLALLAQAAGADPVGRRPYEMVWAGRTADTRPATVDFEELDGWTVECRDAATTFARSREQQLWGQYVGKMVYRGTGPQPVVTIRPPQPVPLAGPVDGVNLWVYGNNWAWAPDATTPPVEIAVLLRGAGGQKVRVSLDRVRWKEWWVMHRRLSPHEIEQLGDAAVLEGIEVAGGRNADDRTLYFDNLAAYHEVLPPLEFEPRPQRNLTLPEGQSPGTNTGPGQLPFPTREETILPDNLTDSFTNTLEETDGEFLFHYRGDDVNLVYGYRPETGTLGDVTARVEGRTQSFHPMADGGVAFRPTDGSEPVAPERIEPVECRRDGDTVVSRWRCHVGEQTAEVRYTLRLWQKSLVIDVASPGGLAGEFRVGKAVGLQTPRLVTLPYLACEARRPAVLVSGPLDRPLFVTAFLDHYRSNASELWAINRVDESGVWYNGGSRYLPRTDGARNDCFERLFLTVSPRVEEVLPNVPNPKSPWMHVAGERLWRAHGASDRERDYALWKKVARYGMTKVVITDHETGWRDGGESFTLRTRAAPGKGGDQGQADYARKVRALGFRYGIYNNYTDFAPVNEHWDEDYVTRLSDGDWRRAWARCYNLKPARAVELEARLAPIIQEKFHLDTAYCDVHTAVRPWQYCDFDARVPGAGTFAATFYAYGEIMLHQKATWNGPVYSEGNNHWYYCGLTDGNYGQDQLAKLDENPWLADFDLRKLHPLCCNFGMGNPGMFYGRGEGLGSTPDQQEARLDRFLAATLAFGHTGFLVLEGGMPNAVRSYFGLQQIHAHYAQETVEEIRYADADGKLLDSSAAVATGAFRRSQIATRYSNGLEVLVNGNATETWKTPQAELPPNGWFASGDLPDGKLVAFSALREGRRVDYVDSPAYVYADGRGRFTKLDKAACDGPLIVHRRDDGSREVVPVGRCTAFGVSLEGRAATAVALDEEDAEMGPAETRFSRGMVFVVPVAGAFSYVLTPGAAPEVELQSNRDTVVPGETVRVDGKGPHEFRVPPDAKPGQRIWRTFEGAWIDFTVVPLVEAKLSVADTVRLELLPHVPAPVEANLTLAGHSQQVRLVPEQTQRVDFPIELPEREEVRELPLEVTAGDLVHRQTWWLAAEDAIVPLGGFGDEHQSGRCLRGEAERPLDGTTRAQVQWTERTCAGETRPCLFMHPPYVGGVGYVFALSPPVDLPKEPAAALRTEIGKGDGSDPGDGILFRVAVVDEQSNETTVAQRQWIDHAWTPLEADFSPWAGRRVRIKLVADVGPADNSSGDWACWSRIRLESARPALVRSVHSGPVELRRRPGPLECKGLSPDDLPRAVSGVLHFQGMGLQAGGEYVSHGTLNEVPLGPLPAAGGNEREGTWVDAAMPLPPQALASLTGWNRLSIRNPGRDSFKVRNFWIELELPDGRRTGSQVTAAAYTQPPEWPYAEGTGVPFDRHIELEIRFGIE